MAGHLAVEEGGLLSTLQDAGRFGWQRYGISPAGAMDRPLLALANALVGNPGDTAAIEITMAGPLLRVEADACRVAVAGDVKLALDGKPVEPHRAYDLVLGQRLRVGATTRGMRAYIAVHGGFGVVPVLGSLSTHTRSAIGGLEGRALRAGDSLPLRAAEAAGPCLCLPVSSRPDRGKGPVRVVLGPQADAFTEAGIATFLSSLYILSAKADRMGCQFEGPAIAHRDGFNIVSDGIVDGSIQVPGSGRPIVLLADRQTTGGYPKIATVIGPDLPRLAQLRPGEAVRFEAIGVEEAAAVAAAEDGRRTSVLRSLVPVPWTASMPSSSQLLALNLVGGVASATDDPFQAPVG